MELTMDMAGEAINLVRPMIRSAMGSGWAKRDHLAIHVAERVGTDYRTVAIDHFGDPTAWEGPYDHIAEGKTVISARTGLSTRVVQELHPELLLPHDVIYWGNAIEGDKIVSCSGVQPWFDEAFSKAILAMILAKGDDQRRLMAGKHEALTYDGSPLGTGAMLCRL